MIKSLIKLLLFAVVVLHLSNISFAQPSAIQNPYAPIESKIVSLVQDAVFEVIVLKPDESSVSYEQPLPTQLMPYAQRIDKYESIGTAFAISKDRFISAAHVIDITDVSQYAGYYLRDYKGNVYQVDKVISFSNYQDFIVFTLKDKTVEHFFEINTKPLLNSTVYTVGNALGEGVVIRGGLYTSTTYEPRNGKWKWLRFSAPASGGNSGGPLLDENGKVLGIVLRGNKTENLNHALPIEEVINIKPDTAFFDSDWSYGFDNMQFKKYGTRRDIFKLPLPIKEAVKIVTEYDIEYGQKMMLEYLDENKSNIFPNNSAQITSIVYSDSTPRINQQGTDGQWSSYGVSAFKSYELTDKGYLEYGKYKDYILFNLHKPEHVSFDILVNDSKQFMDIYLKGYCLYRDYVSQKIRVVSLGRSKLEQNVEDAYKRKWLIRTWDIPYDDSVFVVAILPVPDGFIGISKIVSTNDVVKFYLAELKALMNYMQFSYSGKLRQWSEFLDFNQMLPDTLRHIDISLTKEGFNFKSKRFAISSLNHAIHVTDDSILMLMTNYFYDYGNIVWDINGLSLLEKEGANTGFKVARRTKPPADLREDYAWRWNRAINKQYPYNRSVRVENGDSVIAAVIDLSKENRKGTKLTSAIMYTAELTKEGSVIQGEMEAAFENIVKSLKVIE